MVSKRRSSINRRFQRSTIVRPVVSCTACRIKRCGSPPGWARFPRTKEWLWPRLESTTTTTTRSRTRSESLAVVTALPTTPIPILLNYRSSRRDWGSDPSVPIHGFSLSCQRLDFIRQVSTYARCIDNTAGKAFRMVSADRRNRPAIRSIRDLLQYRARMVSPFPVNSIRRDVTFAEASGIRRPPWPISRNLRDRFSFSDRDVRKVACSDCPRNCPSWE